MNKFRDFRDLLNQNNFISFEKKYTDSSMESSRLDSNRGDASEMRKSHSKLKSTSLEELTKENKSLSNQPSKKVSLKQNLGVANSTDHIDTQTQQQRATTRMKSTSNSSFKSINSNKSLTNSSVNGEDALSLLTPTSSSVQINPNNYLKLPRVDTRPTYYPRVENGNGVQSASMYKTISPSKKALDAIKMSKQINTDSVLSNKSTIKTRLRVKNRLECDKLVDRLDASGELNEMQEKTLRNGFHLPLDIDLAGYLNEVKKVNQKKNQEKIMRMKENQKRLKKLQKDSFFSYN